MVSKKGDFVTVSGRIVRRLDRREIIIRDKSGEIIVDAEFGKFHSIPLNVGQDIIVNGKVDIYWGGPWREIEARTIQVQEKIPEPLTPPQLTVIKIADVREESEDGPKTRPHKNRVAADPECHEKRPAVQTDPGSA